MSEQHRGTILHLDDSEVNRYIVARSLRNAGFEVKEAATGKACLQLVAKQQPDLIILDVQLPDMSGFEGSAAGSRQTLPRPLFPYSIYLLVSSRARTRYRD